MIGQNGPSYSREESFLDLYLEYTKDQESPEAFHLWTAVTILGAALGRKCFIQKKYYRLYPNLFTVLVAGAAFCRKSTAINLGIMTPDEVRLFENIPTVKILSGRLTGEALLDEIADSQIPDTVDPTRILSPNILVHSSELAVFLTRQVYGQTLIEILTDLYDCKKSFEYKTRNKRRVELRDVFLCILAATTPGSVARGITPAALDEGFGSRVLWVYQDKADRVDSGLGTLTDRQRAISKKLQGMLEARAKLEGPFTLSDEARAYYESWYLKYRASAAPDRFLEGAYGRKHDHLLRLGMVFAGNYLRKEIEPGQLDAALSMLENLEATASGAFAEVGGNELTPHLERLKAFMKRYQRVQHSELLRRMHPCNGAMMREIMETLLQTKEVERDKDNGSLYIWRG